METKKPFDTSYIEAIDDELISRMSNRHNKPLLYFAGPWFDEESKSIMDYAERLVEKLGDKCIYEVYFPRQHNSKTPLETFNSNLDAIQNASRVIALVSSKDVGTAFEVGYALGNVPITLLGKDVNTFKSKTNIMLAFCSPRLMVLSDLCRFLLGLECDNYTMTNTWEDKE